MTTGHGIAIAAIWLLPCICAYVDKVSGIGLYIAIAAALIATSLVLNR